jgi:hypothetical protein
MYYVYMYACTFFPAVATHRQIIYGYYAHTIPLTEKKFHPNVRQSVNEISVEKKKGFFLSFFHFSNRTSTFDSLLTRIIKVQPGAYMMIRLFKRSCIFYIFFFIFSRLV